MLKIQRRKVYGTTQFSLQDLVDWSIAHADIPIDENTAYVAAYEYSTVPERNFKVFLTTKRLMQYTLHTNHILADATYKLTLEGYPVLTCGTTEVVYYRI